MPIQKYWMKKKDCQPRTLYPGKTSFRNEDNKDILKGRKTKRICNWQICSKRNTKGNSSAIKETNLELQ